MPEEIYSAYIMNVSFGIFKFSKNASFRAFFRISFAVFLDFLIGGHSGVIVVAKMIRLC